MLLTPASIAPITAGPVSAEKIKTLPGGSAPPVPPSFANSPDFWWKLDEESGTAVANSGSYGTPSDYDGTVLPRYGGSYSWLGSGESWGSGGITGGIDFAPASQFSGWYIRTDNSVPLGGATKFTLAFWNEPDNPDSGDVLFHSGNYYDAGGTQFSISSASTPRYIYTDYESDSGHDDAYSTSNPTTRFTAGSKRHICMVFDFTLPSGGFKLYINGNLEYQANLTGSSIAADSNYSSGNGLQTQIGASIRANYLPAYMWHGAVCDVRMWLDAATAADVTEIYTGEAA